MQAELAERDERLRKQERALEEAHKESQHQGTQLREELRLKEQEVLEAKKRCEDLQEKVKEEAETIKLKEEELSQRPKHSSEGPTRGMGKEYGLSDGEVFQAWGSFKELDADDSGSIDIHELTILLHSMMRMYLLLSFLFLFPPPPPFISSWYI